MIDFIFQTQRRVCVCACLPPKLMQPSAGCTAFAALKVVRKWKQNILTASHLHRISNEGNHSLPPLILLAGQIYSLESKLPVLLTFTKSHHSSINQRSQMWEQHRHFHHPFLHRQSAPRTQTDCHPPPSRAQYWPSPPPHLHRRRSPKS